MVNGLRSKQIPNLQDIDPLELDNFNYFLDQAYIGSELDRAIQEFAGDPGLSTELNKFVSERLLDVYQKERSSLIAFFREELLNILSELRLLDKSSKIILVFDRQQGAGVMETENNFYRVRINVINIALALLHTDLSSIAEKKAVIVQNLAHEFFHIYLNGRYKHSEQRTLQASEKAAQGDKSEYDKDRGEIASELYSIKHLGERARKLGESSILGKAFKSEAARVQTLVNLRLGKEEKTV